MLVFVAMSAGFYELSATTLHIPPPSSLHSVAPVIPVTRYHDDIRT
jgi:hypothetical protein